MCVCGQCILGNSFLSSDHIPYSKYVNCLIECTQSHFWLVNPISFCTAIRTFYEMRITIK